MAVKPKWLGGFVGANLGRLNYEIFTIQHFALTEREKETELMTVKWFDYRRLHPLQATYYFVHCYTVAYQDFTKVNIDVDRAPYVRCFTGVDFLTAREKVTIYKLRQLVDRMGMRYDFFLSFAMAWYHKMVGENGKIYAPRPGHLLNNEELIASAMIAWEELCDISLQVSCNAYYRVSNFAGRFNKDQLAHEAFVVGQIKRRKHPRFSLSLALYKHDAVRVEEAVRQFGGVVVDAAIEEFESLHR